MNWGVLISADSLVLDFMITAAFCCGAAVSVNCLWLLEQPGLTHLKLSRRSNFNAEGS